MCVYKNESDYHSFSREGKRLIVSLLFSLMFTCCVMSTEALKREKQRRVSKSEQCVSPGITLHHLNNDLKETMRKTLKAKHTLDEASVERKRKYT